MSIESPHARDCNQHALLRAFMPAWTRQGTAEHDVLIERTRWCVRIDSARVLD